MCTIESMHIFNMQYKIPRRPTIFAQICSIQQHTAWNTVSHNAMHMTRTSFFSKLTAKMYIFVQITHCFPSDDFTM